MKKILRIALRLAVFGALDVLTVLLFANLQNAGVISPLLAGIFMGVWSTYALLACFPSAPIPNR